VVETFKLRSNLLRSTPFVFCQVLLKIIMRDKIVLTVGVWDLIHRGHVDFLNGIKREYPKHKLVVGVLSNQAVKKKKGKNRPIIGENNRLEMIKNLKMVDEAFICKYFENKEDSMNYEIKRINPDKVILGTEKTYKISTTAIIDDIIGTII